MYGNMILFFSYRDKNDQFFSVLFPYKGKMKLKMKQEAVKSQ